MSIRSIAVRVAGVPGTAVEQLQARPRATDALVATLLAGLLLPQSLALLFGLRTDRGWPVAVVAALAAVHLTPALRRTAPVTGYGLACLAMLILVTAPNGRFPLSTAAGDVRAFPMVFLPSSLLFLPALNAVAVQAHRRVSVPALLAAVIGTGLAMVRVSQSVSGAFPGVQYESYILLALMIAVLSAWGLGTARVTRARLEAAARAEAARTAILAERSRIARDMHDVVAHSLAVVVRLAEAGATLTTSSPERAHDMLVTIAGTGRDALRDMRGIVGVLRDPDAGPGPGPDAGPGTSPDGPPEHGPAVLGPQPTLAELPVLLERVRATGVTAELTQSGTALPLGTAIQLAAYHVVQEATTNTVKHVGAGARIDIDLEWHADHLVLRIEDDGGKDDGGDPGSLLPRGPSPVPGGGAGLTGLRERVAAVGGSLHAGRLGRGFAVRAELPTTTGRSEGGRR